MVAPHGRFDGTLTVVPNGQQADVHGTFSGKQLRFNVGGNPDDLANALAWNIDIDLTGHGVSTRDLAESLDGRISVVSDGGRIRNLGLGLALGGFARELTNTLNPFNEQDQYTKIHCAKFVLVANDGLIETDPNLVLQTDKINLLSKGSIDLDTEQIDLNFDSKPRKRLSISAGELINPYVRVAGTLSEPYLTINRRSTAIAAVTAGWSIIAQAAWDRTFRAENPCE
jgi:uncharacterized protein involved in outer membrane biogenesis